MATCKGCGNRLITSLDAKCIRCGHPKGMFQGGTVTWTKRGARKVAEEETYVGFAGAVGGFAAIDSVPGPLRGLTWQQAEVLARDWMRKHGYRDARLTSRGADGGVDVVARKAVAQVKHHAKPVGLAEVQRLYGIATSMRKKALFFSSSGFTPKAREWARHHDVQCYRFPPVARIK